MIQAVITGHNVTTQDLGGFCGVGRGETGIAKIRLSSLTADVKNVYLVGCFAIERGDSYLTTRNVWLNAHVVRTEVSDEEFDGKTVSGAAVVMKIHNRVTEYAADVFAVFAAN